MFVLSRISAMVCIIFAVLYAVKKITNQLEIAKLSRVSELGYYEDRLVYKAAQAFAQGKPAGTVKGIMSGSYEFDAKRIEQTISLAQAHRNDRDGGYGGFLTAANRVLGEEVYHSDSRA